MLCHYTECHVIIIITMLTVVMLIAIILSVVMLSVVKLSFMAPERSFKGVTREHWIKKDPSQQRRKFSPKAEVLVKSTHTLLGFPGYTHKLQVKWGECSASHYLLTNLPLTCCISTMLLDTHLDPEQQGSLTYLYGKHATNSWNLRHIVRLVLTWLS
jgi:hypothetical protein